MDRVSYLIVFVATFGIFLYSAAAQTVHIVGDGLGWNIPPNTSVSYANWASGKTFTVGDILVFNFMTNQHDVVRVPRASYDACTQENAIGSIITTGPANITLDSTGDHYYICTFGRHCESGQRLSITVGSPGANPPMTTPTPTTPTTPSPASPQPDACAPTPSTTPNARGPTAAMTPPPDSASTSLAGGFLLVLFSAGIALIF